MTTSEKAPTKAALIAGFATIYIVWGSTYLGIKIAVETLPPFLMGATRFLVAGGILAAWIAFTRGFKATPRQWFDNSIIGALLLLGGNGLVSWAEQKIPSGIATLIVSLGPLFIVLLDWAVHAFGSDKTQGTKPGWATFAGLSLGIIGLALLVGPSFSQGTAQPALSGAEGSGLSIVESPGLSTVESLDPWRVAGLVLACFCWSVGSLYTRYARNPAEPFTGSAMQMIAGSVWLFLVSLLMREPMHFDFAAVSARSLFAWCYLVGAGSLIGFTTFVWLMKHSTPARVSTYAYVNPIVAVFLGWLIAHEPVGSRMFVAAAIIIAGVGIITTAKNKKSLTTPPRQAVACAETRPASDER